MRERAEFLASFKNLDESRYLPHIDYRRWRGFDSRHGDQRSTNSSVVVA